MRTLARFTKISTRERGFSLIELMVTVAIISIMASMAIPNLQQMSRKSLQAEAKNTLADMFTIEKMFFTDQGYYTMCLQDAGYLPTQGLRRYLSGTYGGGGGCNTATATYPGCWASNVDGTSCLSYGNVYDQYGSHNHSTFYPSDTGAAYMSKLAPPESDWGITDKTTYLLVADGWIGGALPDVWTIDQSQNLINVQSGL